MTSPGTALEARFRNLLALACVMGALLAGSDAAAQAAGCRTRTSTADFLAGVRDGTAVGETDSSAAAGLLELQPGAADLFLDPALGPAWVVTRPAAGAQPLIAGGVMDVQMESGGLPVTSSGHMAATSGPGAVCEARVLLQPGSNFSSVGFFADTATLTQWAYFSTFGTGDDSVTVIHTSVRDSSGVIAGVPTGLTLDEWHDLRIVWQPGVLEFWADGVLLDTRTGVGFSQPLRFGFYKSGGSDSSLLVDWVRVTPYQAGSGSYESAVQDAGVAGSAWTGLTWTGSEPAGTGVAFATRTGETAAPDSAWSAWEPVSGAAVASPPGRYAQFRATLTTADLLAGPAVQDVEFCFETPPDTTAPTLVAFTPADGATGVPGGTLVTATFDEPVDPATLTAATFTVAPGGGEAVPAGVALDSTGTVATLTPDAPLAHFTTFEARVAAAVTDAAGNALGADIVWTFTTEDVDLEPPTVVDTSPADGATGILADVAVRATFSEPVDPATVDGAAFTLKPVDGSPLPAAVHYDPTSQTAILVPDAELAYATTYEARLATAIADPAGNPLGADEAWTFTTRLTPPVCFTATATADFAAGLLDDLALAETDSSARGGQLRLPPAAGALFLEPTLGPDWVVTRSGPDAQPSIVQGVMDAQFYDGDEPVTSTAHMAQAVAAPVVCEYRGQLRSGSNFSTMGLMSDSDLREQRAYFSTFGTGPDSVPVIHTVIRDTSGVIAAVPTAVTPDAWHVFRIEVLADRVEFYADGVHVDTRTGTGYTMPLRFAYYKSGGSATAMPIDWVRVTPYQANAGSHDSAVLDAGAAGTAWTDLTWNGSEPAGTTVALATRTGETAVPDASWSPWEPLAGGTTASPPGRYAQFRLDLTTSDLMISPAVDDVRFCYETPPDTTAPAIIASTPADGATGVPAGTLVTATFDEPVDPATLTAATFTVAPGGGEAVPAGVALDSTGTVATLTPDAPLAHFTTFEARVAAAVTDTAGNALGADIVWTFTTEDVDLEPPLVVAHEPAPGATGVSATAVVRATFSEGLDPATVDGTTFTLTPDGGSPVPATVSYDGSTLAATLVPDAELAYATTYEARLTTGIADPAGNPLGADEAWTFTTRLTPPVCFTATATADFAAGLLDDLALAETDSSARGGQLRLPPAAGALFLEPTLGPDWVVTRSGPDAQPSIVQGVMDAQFYDGDEPVTSTAHMAQAVAAPVVCEYRGQLRSGSNFSTMGLMSDSDLREQRAYFSTFGTGPDSVPVIHTVIRDTSGVIAAVPTAVTPDAWHVFRIEVLADRVEFYADGVHVDTRTGTGYTMPLRFAYYKSGGSATAMPIDWVRVTPYQAASGSYVSPVHDTGDSATAWTELNWTGSEPVGTAVAFETRTGEAAVPDSTWSAWAPLAGADIASPPGRYGQYRALLTSGDPLASPAIDEVRFCYTPTAAADTTAPAVTATVPEAGAGRAPLEGPVSATFSERLDPATVTTASFTLVPDGGPAVAATVGLDSTGTVATLVPDALLAPNTVYTATLATALADTAGNALAEAFVWSFTTASGPSAAELPRATALLPNYPNPFNPRTTVAFDLAREGRVRVRIYSVDGRLVRTLVAGTLPAGRHTLVWSGDDDRGRGVATGVYLLRMETAETSRTRKMLLLQ